MQRAEEVFTEWARHTHTLCRRWSSQQEVDCLRRDVWPYSFARYKECPHRRVSFHCIFSRFEEARRWALGRGEMGTAGRVSGNLCQRLLSHAVSEGVTRGGKKV